MTSTTTSRSELPWSAQAYRFLLMWSAEQAYPFSATDVRRAAYLYGLRAPPTENAWGGVVKRASKRGNIRKTRHYAKGSKAKWVCAQVDCGS